MANFKVIPLLQTISWKHRCYFCDRPITGVMPVILFAIDMPLFVGVAHDACYGDRPNLGRYQVKTPSHLSPEQVSFLVQFYPMLFALPNAFKPNVVLRLWLVDFIHHYPMNDPMLRLRDYKKMNPNKPMNYEGDLEADYIRFMAEVEKAAKENPVGIEFDFS